MAKDSDKRYKNWCFTLNNYNEKEIEELKDMDDYTYLLLGFEIGEKKTPHIQGFVKFSKAVRLSKLKKVNKRIHWEQTRGTDAENITYCKKDGKFAEFGEYKNEQGKRNDIHNLAEEIKKGKSKKEIIDEFPELYIKYNKGIETMINHYTKDRSTAPQVVWVCGKAGSGKTRLIAEKFPDYYPKPPNKWWDGYCNQECICFDDFDPTHMNFREFLMILDRYKYQGEIKGGFVKINSPYIYITCEFAPDDLWTGNTLMQVLRRIDKIIYKKRNEKDIIYDLDKNIDICKKYAKDKLNEKKLSYSDKKRIILNEISSEENSIL